MQMRVQVSMFYKHMNIRRRLITHIYVCMYICMEVNSDLDMTNGIVFVRIRAHTNKHTHTRIEEQTQTNIAVNVASH